MDVFCSMKDDNTKITHIYTLQFFVVLV